MGMSYNFTGSPDSLSGSFTTSYSPGITMACWIKFTDHPAAVQHIMNFGASAAATQDSYRCNLDSTDNRFRAAPTNSAGTLSASFATKTGIDNTWVPYIADFASTTSRQCYISDQSGTSATNIVVAAAKFIKIANTLGGSSYFIGKIAEVAFWNTSITSGQRLSFRNGEAANTIATANLIGYWPLSSSNATQENLGNDATGDLSVNGATWSSDHPTIVGREQGSAIWILPR